MMLVTGGAGFIGSHLAERLAGEGHRVRVVDNLSSGNNPLKHENIEFVRADLLTDNLSNLLDGVETVFHLAANRDIRSGEKSPERDINQNILATFRLLESMRSSGAKNIVFTSTSAVYGEARVIPTPEDYSPLQPISVYGASKLSCEALLSSYHHTFGMNAWIFRLANIIGEGSDHGVVFDFVRKLKRNPNRLEILGNGEQNKSYLDVEDTINGMLTGFRETKGFQIFNVGSETQIKVKRIAEIVCEEMDVAPEFAFTGGDRGWKGDVPVMLLDTSRLKSLGWEPKLDSEAAVRKAARHYIRNIE